MRDKISTVWFVWPKDTDVVSHLFNVKTIILYACRVYNNGWMKHTHMNAI